MSSRWLCLMNRLGDRQSCSKAQTAVQQRAGFSESHDRIDHDSQHASQHSPEPASGMPLRLERWN